MTGNNCRRAMKVFYLAAMLFVFRATIAHGQWQPQNISSHADFRGLCVVNAKIAWVSGTKGMYGRTNDGGETWSVGTVPGAERLDFRDVAAFGQNAAYLLSAGPGEDSRIYKTVDGGKNWLLQFKNADPKGFFDALAFWDENHGIAVGDPVNGQFQLIVTDDDGANWKPLLTNRLPPAFPNEGAFAASGTCLAVHGQNDVSFCTGGAKTARVFHSSDRGQSWSVADTPIVAGSDAAGIFSIAFRDRNHRMIVGGNYRKPDEPCAATAITADAGKTWTLVRQSRPYRSCVAWAKDRWIVVGTSGSDLSPDDGATWKPLDKMNYNSVAFTTTGEGWAVGPKGRIAKFAR